MLDMEAWQKRWTMTEWSDYLRAGESAIELSTLRQCPHSGRPLGTTEFVAQLEQKTLRTLAPQKGGRPQKPTTDPRQIGFAFHCLGKLGNVPSVPGFPPGFPPSLCLLH
jgi:hypothetical protein